MTLAGSAAAPTAWAKTTLAAAPNLSAFRRALLAWYRRHGRPLPWRETRDPYAIWLSEIMLQQTRVAAVLDHYRIFLERFPTVEALASAPEDAVLAAWSGLGYYRRARFMHQCAKVLVARHDARLPRTAAELLTLPGIGRYTAAAIASIAFGESVAVVDGNVERVLQRRAGIKLSCSHLWRDAHRLLAPSRPADFNQAMMELGATVCLPRQPRCSLCPVRKGCHTGDPLASPSGPMAAAELPALASPPSIKKQLWCALNLRHGSVRLVRRPARASLMPGMWELPQSPRPPRPAPPFDAWKTFRHSITVTQYTVHVFRDLTLPSLTAAAPGHWIALPRVPQLPLTGLARKILRAAGLLDAKRGTR